MIVFPTFNRPPKDGEDTHAMGKDNVIAIKKPEPFVDDPISAVLRQGARSLIAQALEIEIETFPFLHKTRSIEHLIP